MSLTELLDSYIGNSCDIINLTAQKIKDYTSELQANNLSKEEYNDLCKDTLDLSKITDEMNYLKNKILINTAFEALSKALQFIPL